MNYQLIYDRIIAKYKNETKESVRAIHGYSENHHIIPRCMGGTDDSENLVHLPAKAHFLVHYLLVKIFPKHRGVWSALAIMASVIKTENRSARIYDLVRSNMKGHKLTEETIIKLKASMKIAMKGYNPSDRAKETAWASIRGSIWITNGTKDKFLKKTEEIPDGWKPGRLSVPSLFDSEKQSRAGKMVKNREFTKERRSVHGKAILINGVRFRSATGAARALGGTRKDIRNMLEDGIAKYEIKS